MSKIGRPRKADEPMALTVSMRVTRAEYHYLQDRARREGRSVADVLRFLALAGMPRPAAEPGCVGSKG
jgi:hypothetical protein